MRVKVMGFILIMLAVTCVTATVALALADCPPGKTGVTIVPRGGGIVKERCISEQAADHMRGRGAVIPATCPCWTPDSIDANARSLSAPDSVVICMAQFPPAGHDISLTRQCTEIECPGYFLAATHFNTGQNIGWCQLWDEEFGVVPGGPPVTITEDEVIACRAILIKSEMGDLNCDGWLQ